MRPKVESKLMELGQKIRELRLTIGLSQGHLATTADLSQAYLSQIENGDVKNPSAAILLRLAGAMHVDPDDLFEAAGYPSVRTLRRSYKGYEVQVDPALLQYLARLPRDRQRRLLLFLEGMEHLADDALPQQQETQEEARLSDHEVR